MSPIRGGAVVSLVLLSFAAGAQTIERSYADQCGDGQESETCTVLREALARKLAAEAGNVGPARAATPRPAPAEVAKWGVLGRMAEVGAWTTTTTMGTGSVGTGYSSCAWIDAGAVRCSSYLVTFDGEMRQSPASVTVHHLQGDGSTTWTLDGKPMGEAPIQALNSTILRPMPSGAAEIEVKEEGDRLLTTVHSVIDGKRELATRTVQEPAAGRTLADVRAAARHEIAAREQAAAEARRDGNAGARALVGFIHGFADATADNQAMSQSMDDAISRGLAQGAAEYERHGSGSASTSAYDGGLDESAPPEGSYGDTADFGAQPRGAANDAGRGATQGGTLRFVLMVPLREPINGTNAFCFSNIVTVPDVPGWRVRGFDHSIQHAQALVEAKKAGFVAECRRRAALHSEHVEIAWNELGEESDPDDVVARFSARGFPQVQLD